MNASAPRRLVLRQSLTKPILFFGGDRFLTCILWAIVLITIVIAKLNFYIMGTALAAGLIGQLVLQRWAKADPLWFWVYLRSLHYKPYYPAHSRVGVKARVRPTL